MRALEERQPQAKYSNHRKTSQTDLEVQELMVRSTAVRDKNDGKKQTQGSSDQGATSEPHGRQELMEWSAAVSVSRSNKSKRIAFQLMAQEWHTEAVPMCVYVWLFSAANFRWILFPHLSAPWYSRAPKSHMSAAALRASPAAAACSTSGGMSARSSLSSWFAAQRTDGSTKARGRPLLAVVGTTRMSLPPEMAP